jgi:hypothetical protein
VHRVKTIAALSFIGGFVQPVPQSLVEYGGSTYQMRQASFQDLTLTPSNVKSSTFGKLESITLDGGQIYSQPLFVQGVTIGTGTYDVVLAATMNNSLWAIDANTYRTLWKVNFGSTWTGYPNYSGSENSFYQNTPMGCVSTPAVDRANGLIYSVCPTSSGEWVLRKIQLSSGSILASVTITGQFPGTGDSGDTVIDGQLQFYSAQHLNRPGLVLANGNVYIAFSSFSDEHPWHGWLFAYSQSSLSQVAVWCSTPNGYGGGIWLTGDAPPVDSSGNIYISTGNGLYDGTADYADSIVKLSSTLSILDWFTPSNYAAMEANDWDATSGQIMLSPDGRVFAADKNFREYVIQAGCMGHLQGSASSCSPQLVSIPTTTCPLNNCGIYGGLFFGNTVYIPENAGPIFSYAYSGGMLAGSATAQTSASFGHPGARIVMSANGSVNAVLWATTAASSAFDTAQAGVLRAFDPVSLAELYNSTENSGDSLGTWAKMSTPVIVNGHVWVATGDGTIQVYGLK